MLISQIFVLTSELKNSNCDCVSISRKIACLIQIAWRLGKLLQIRRSSVSRNFFEMNFFSNFDPDVLTVFPELFCQISPILIKFIAKFARFLAQNRGKFASFYPHVMVKLTPHPINFDFYCINIFKIQKIIIKLVSEKT